ATSPRLWPTTTSGTTPHERQSSVSAICTQEISGCTTSTSSNLECAGSAESSSSSDHPASSRTTRSQRSSTALKTGSAAISPRPIPSHCEPCGEYTNTSGP